MHVYKTVVRNKSYNNRLCDWTNCDNVKVWDAEPPVSKGEIPDWFCDEHKPDVDWPALQAADDTTSQTQEWIDAQVRDILNVFAPHQRDEWVETLIRYGIIRGYLEGKRNG